MSNKYDFIVVGGGIVGLASAYKLQLKFSNKSIAILEKEAEVGKHQTGRNSGVMHSGIYYKPGSYKAKNCNNGLKQLVEFSEKNNVLHDVCGKIIVATSVYEIPILEELGINPSHIKEKMISILLIHKKIKYGWNNSKFQIIII